MFADGNQSGALNCVDRRQATERSSLTAAGEAMRGGREESERGNRKDRGNGENLRAGGVGVAEEREKRQSDCKENGEGRKRRRRKNSEKRKGDRGGERLKEELKNVTRYRLEKGKKLGSRERGRGGASDEKRA